MLSLVSALATLNALTRANETSSYALLQTLTRLKCSLSWQKCPLLIHPTETLSHQLVFADIHDWNTVTHYLNALIHNITTISHTVLKCSYAHDWKIFHAHNLILFSRNVHTHTGHNQERYITWYEMLSYTLLKLSHSQDSSLWIFFYPFRNGWNDHTQVRVRTHSHYWNALTLIPEIFLFTHTRTHKPIQENSTKNYMNQN